MAAINPPGFLQNAGATHTAEQVRNWMSVVVGGSNASNSLIARGGVTTTRGNSLIVTQTGSPSMAVLVRSGHAFIPGSEGSKQGVYSVMNDADVTLSIAAAHATLNRIDLVCFKVEDQAYSGSVNACSLVVVTGTPASSPSAPTAPANSITLASVSIVANDTSITNGEITDLRNYVVGSGGILLVRSSSARPAAGTVAPGHMNWNLATSKYEFTPDGGTSWVDGMPLYKARNTLSGTTASVTFSSIPSNLRSLKLRLRIRSNSGSAVNVLMTINGAGGTAYTWYVTGSTDSADITPIGAGGQASAVVGSVPGSGTRFSSYEVTFDTWDISTVLNWHNNGFAYDGSNLYYRAGGGEYNAAGPYTSITIAPSAGSWVSGSDFQLEGTYA